jgi:hypothetical protein
MNNLSLLLYFAGVSGALQPLLGAVGGLGALLTTVVKGASLAEEFPFTAKGYFTACALCVLVACLLPSERTVYMIAASEVSGRAVSSPQGQEVLNLLTQKIIAGLGK